MVTTRKNSFNNFIPLKYSPPKRPRGKQQVASESKKPESLQALIAMGEDLQSDKNNVAKNDDPNIKSTVDMSAIDREFEEVFANEMVADILNRCRIKRKTDAPRIPLCRILRNEAVRVVSKCDLKMREVFRNDGYLPEKGQFVLSMKTSKGNDVLVSDVIKAKWDDYWKEINEEFENEIKDSEDWKELSGRMFLCWDGNHRTAAWMEEIRSNHEFQFDKKRHISVSASFIDVEKCHVMQLISALNRINELNEDGVIHNTMKDTLYSVQKVATANPEQYRSKLDPQYLASLKIKDNASSSVGTDQWYQLPRLAYCKLLFQRQIDKEISMEVGLLKEGDDVEALKLVATKKVHEKWVHKMGKLLAIVNPALGQSWFDAVTRADIDTKTSRLSIEKLLDMVKAKVPNHVRDRWVHWMSAGTAIHSTYGIPKGDKAFKEWVKKEVWLEHLIEKACDVFKETSNEYGLEVVVPHGEDLESWFRAFKLANRTNMFKTYHKHMSATLGASECYEIDKSSRRVCYRYYKHLHNGKHLEKLPNELKSWKTLDENGMYSKKGNLDRVGGLSDYEIQNCPWWIDFIIGEYPLEEEAEYKANSKVLHPKRPRESIEKVSHELGNRSSDGKITKRKKLKQATLKTSSEVDVFDDLNEEDLSTPFDISSISSHVDVQIVCHDVLRAYEQYTKKLDCPCFNEVREFAKVHSRDSHKYSRSGVTRDWGYDLVIIDFPTHDLQSNDYLEVPEWNKCTHSLVQAAFSFGTLCLDDDGWIVSICSPEQWKSIEKEARLKCLETTRFYFLQQDGAFGYTKDRMGMVANNVLIVNLWSRKGTKPSLQTSGISESDSFSCAKASLKHFFTPGSRLAASQSSPSRKLIEKSIDFMKFIIENMSPKEGLILDLFSGTGSTLVASAILSRHCYGIDNDKALVEHVRFTRLSKLQKVPPTTTEKRNISFDEESEDEIPQEDDEPA